MLSLADMGKWINLDEEATLTDFLIAFLCSARSTRAFYRIMHERVLARHKAQSVRTTLSRLKKKGFVKSDKNGWSITENGQKHYRNRERFSFIRSPFPDKAPDNLVVGFDIPELNRHLRNWLRAQLKIFGYRMIQQSLWMGPGPLPQEFGKRLIELDIKDNLKIFKLSKPH